jgi:hypothetical protein
MTMMTLDDFKKGLAETVPPRGLSAALTAMWWVGKDDWDKAHRIVMDESDADCAWVHAYLHRVQGDLGNAGYWYRQAGRKPVTGELAAEWATIAAALLPGQAP